MKEVLSPGAVLLLIIAQAVGHMMFWGAWCFGTDNAQDLGPTADLAGESAAVL